MNSITITCQQTYVDRSHDGSSSNCHIDSNSLIVVVDHVPATKETDKQKQFLCYNRNKLQEQN